MDNPSHLHEAEHRRLVAAVALLATTPLAPKGHERELLTRYQVGALSMDEVIACLEESTYHVLYRSRAIHVPTKADLQAVLDSARPYNAQQQITGLLLCSDERFVQLLEGPEAAVRALYARIQQDSRHTQVVTVSEGTGPQRWFTGWHMAFGCVEALELQQTLRAMEAKTRLLFLVKDPHLQTLLHAFNLPDSFPG